MQITTRLYVKNRDEWRAWLERNHKRASEIWLTYYKRHTGQPSIPYAEAVEEALCYGWIDGIVKRIDDDHYTQRFTPRRAKSMWSALNRRRARRLVDEGLMTSAGTAVLPADLLSDEGEDGTVPSRASWEEAVPTFILEALETNLAAREFFAGLATSYRRQYVGWIMHAKREETRDKRLREAVEMLARKRKLGMK